MKSIILQENLHKALGVVSRISANSGQLPILGTVLLEANEEGLFFSATNLEMSIKYLAGAKNEKEGKVVVPVKQFLEIVSSLPKDKVVLEKKENKLYVSCLKTNASINTLNDEEFPHLPKIEEKKLKGSLVFDREELIDCIGRTTFSASMDESRAVLTGVLFSWGEEKMEAVATDGYRLSLYKLKKNIIKKEDKTKKIIIPAKALNEVQRVLGEEKEVKLFLDEKENQAVFSFENGQIFCRLIDGEYPDFEKIIPSEKGEAFEVERQELERAVKLASIFARDASNIIRFKVEKNNFSIEANSAEVGRGSSTIDLEGENEEKQVAFNFRFIADILRVVQSERIKIFLQDEQKPGIFLEKGKNNFLHIIMPVKI